MNWFGDCTHSIVSARDIVGVSGFGKVYQPKRKGLYRVALYDFLSDIAWEVNYTTVTAPDTVNIDEEALEKLLQWAKGGFKPTGPPREWAPGQNYTRHFSGCASCGGSDHMLRQHPVFLELRLCDGCNESSSGE